LRWESVLLLRQRQGPAAQSESVRHSSYEHAVLQASFAKQRPFFPAVQSASFVQVMYVRMVHAVISGNGTVPRAVGQAAAFGRCCFGMGAAPHAPPALALGFRASPPHAANGFTAAATTMMPSMISA